METGYSQLELEARALRFGVDKFRYYLEGIEKVTCFVGAKALLPFFNHENREESNAKDWQSRISHWSWNTLRGRIIQVTFGVGNAPPKMMPLQKISVIWR